MKFHLSLTLLLLLTALAPFSPSARAQTSEKLKGNPIGLENTKPKDAFDDDATTSYTARGNEYAEKYRGSYCWVGLDLGQPHIITGVSWKGQNVTLGTFMGANNPDFSDAKPLYLIKNAYAEQPAPVNVTKGFQYVKYVGPSESYGEITDLAFYGYPDEGNEGEEGEEGKEEYFYQITNLPTVVINTVEGEIPYDKENEIKSTTIIIDDHKIDIEAPKTGVRERGNASREFPKKPWRLKFDESTKLLGSKAKGKKWTLINNYGDKTLMRNLLAFDVAEKFGMAYVPFHRSVDVLMNGEYKGSYQLCDQIDVRKNRVDVTEIEKGTVLDEKTVTGGYLIEVDGYGLDEPYHFVSGRFNIPVTIKSPDDGDVPDDKEAYKQYIADFFTNIENLLDDTDPETGYRKLFDTKSFIRHMLTNEVAGNTDCYWSTYMYKDRDGEDGEVPKMYTGPVWDFDLGFNNDYRTYPVPDKSGYGYLWEIPAASAANGMRSFARKVLIEDPTTAAEIQEVWEEAKENGFSTQWLSKKVEEYAALLRESQELNFMRWPILNSQEHMNPVVRGSYEEECRAVIDYIEDQMEHLEDVVAGTSEPDFAAPEYVPDPKHGADEIYSAFTKYGNNLNYSVGNWEQPTLEKIVTLADGNKAVRLANFNYQGWVGFDIDISKYGYMHVDYWTPDAKTQTFGFTPISKMGTGTQERTKEFNDVKIGEWNSYDVELKYFTESFVDLKHIVEMKFAQNPGNAEVGYIANIYFYGEPQEGQVTEIPAPATVPEPRHDPDHVFSIYSNYGNNVAYNIGGWGQSTGETPVTIDGREALRFMNFNYQGWEFQSIDISEYDYMHVDYWTPTAGTPFGFVPISKHDEQGNEKTLDNPIWWAPEVKAGEWNSYDVPLTVYEARMSGIEQIKLNADLYGGRTDVAYVANVYFWKEDPMTLRLSAEADEITQNSAVINYSVTLPEGFEGAEVNVAISGEPQATRGDGDQFVVNGLEPYTQYTYKLQATASKGGETLTSEETEVVFTTLRDPSMALVYHRIDNGFLINAYKTDENKTMSRNFPVTMQTEVSYNADKTMTVRFKVNGAENITGWVPEINFGGEWSGDLSQTIDEEGYYSFTPGRRYEGDELIPGKTYEEGQSILNFYWLKFDGFADQRIEFTTIVGETNNPVGYGEPAGVVINAPSTEDHADVQLPFCAYLVDENGNFLLGAEYEPTVRIDETKNSAEGVLNLDNKYFITLGKKGTSTVLADYDGLEQASMTFLCNSSGPQGTNLALGKTVKLTSDTEANNLGAATDGDAERSELFFSCAETHEHSIRIDFDKICEINWVRIVWEGASAKHYDFSLFVDYDNTIDGRQRVTAERYTHEVTDGDGGAGMIVTYNHELPEPVYANTFTLNTYQAYEPAWGMKIKQVFVYGTETMLTGLEGIYDGNADVEYYNMQGVRVKNPAPGIYIRRQGGKVDKVIIN